METHYSPLSSEIWMDIIGCLVFVPLELQCPQTVELQFYKTPLRLDARLPTVYHIWDHSTVSKLRSELDAACHSFLLVQHAGDPKLR